MKALFKYELKSSIKSFLIWTLVVGGMGFFCLILFKSMESQMAGMAENFASMGSFSDAFGMNVLSIATAKGFFATEIGTIHALGASLFAASVATVILSKEEDSHTAEFTYTLPITRAKVVVIKAITVVTELFLFTAICGLLYYIGFAVIGETNLGSEFFAYIAAQFMMSIEVGAICFFLSAVSKKNRLGIGIGVAMLLYILDLMARVIPDLEKVKMITPFSYANAAEILSKTADSTVALIFGICITIFFFAGAGVLYVRRDLAS